MIVIVCVDQRNGLAFNGRRQSRDRMVAADILKESAGRRLWMTPSSRRLFLPEAEISQALDCLDRAGPGELCFAEGQLLRPWIDRIEGMILYRWDRVYPADLHLDVVPSLPAWHLVSAGELPGFSHKKIEKEVYLR